MQSVVDVLVGPLLKSVTSMGASDILPSRSDCVDILTQCGDRRRFREGQTPERICDMLSPTDDPERCIPLERYLSEFVSSYGPQEAAQKNAHGISDSCNSAPIANRLLSQNCSVSQ